jgi:hypothetical protein
MTTTFEYSDIRVRWNLDGDLPLYKPRFNVAPETSPNIPVIVRQKGVNECRVMQWGLIPNWAADPTIGNRMINARANTFGGIVTPICFADLRLMTNSHFVAAPTGDTSGWHLSEFLPLWWTAFRD